jgi:hypothetical protein
VWSGTDNSLEFFNMLTRNLAIALVASLGIHILGMTAVTIITPEDFFKTEPFTKVTFLGPILEKTAFEMMVEGSDPVARTRYTLGTLSGADKYLRVSITKVDTGPVGTSSLYESNMDLMIRGFLSGNKITPSVMFGLDPADALMKEWNMGSEEVAGRRKVAYRPELPVVTKGLYGQADAFSVKVKALLDGGGRVIRAEALTTTGYPGLDISATKYVKGWIFEPTLDADERGEWVEVDVILKVSTGGV